MYDIKRFGAIHPSGYPNEKLYKLYTSGSSPVGPTNSLKGGEGSDGEDDVYHAGDQRAGADPPEDGDRVLLRSLLAGMPVLPTFVGLAVAVNVTFGGLYLLPLLPPRTDEEYGLRGDGLHAVVHHEADIHDAVGPVVWYALINTQIHLASASHFLVFLNSMHRFREELLFKM